MKDSMTQFLWILALIAVSFITSAADNEPPTPSAETIAPAEPAAAKNPKAEATDADAEPAPSAQNLRARDLGEAFRTFTPSEEISADNAVTFPVDI